MQYFYNKAVILLLVSSALTLFSSVDADCDSEFASFASFSPPCDEVVEGVCPYTCNVAIDSLHTTCSMDGATFDGRTTESITTSVFSTILVTQILLAAKIPATGACKEVILDKTLNFADTCQEITDLTLLASYSECKNDNVQCSKFCMDMLDAFYATCSSDDTFIHPADASTKDISFVTWSLNFYLGDTCGVYKDTKEFAGGDPVDDDCDSEFASLAFLCDGADGICPSTCNDAVDGLHTTCSMDGATFNGRPTESSTIMLAAKILATGACEEVILDKALTFADTCQEITTLNLAASILECGDDSEQCSKFCMDMLDDFYATCSSDDTYVTATSTATQDVSTAALALTFFLSDTCGVYKDTKEFAGGDPVDDDCDSEFASLAFLCDEVDGVCPSTCNDAVDSLHTTCSMDGATFNGRPTESSTILLAAKILATGACEEVILDKALNFADTCQEITTLNLAASTLECGDDSEQCSKFCMDMLDAFYATCTSGDTYVTTGDITQDVSTVALTLKNLMNETCGVYQDTKEFAAGDYSAGGASVMVGVGVAVFVAIVSVAISL